MEGFKSADELRFVDIIQATNCFVTAAVAGGYQNDAQVATAVQWIELPFHLTGLELYHLHH